MVCTFVNILNKKGKTH